MMNESTRIRNKKKLVVDFLQDLRDNDELGIPVHRMNINEWYSLFESKTANISNEGIFKDKRYFAMQMNNIAQMRIFDSIFKIEERVPVYEVYYEVHTSEVIPKTESNCYLSFGESSDDEVGSDHGNNESPDSVTTDGKLA